MKNFMLMAAAVLALASCANTEEVSVEEVSVDTTAVVEDTTVVAEGDEAAAE